MRVSQPRHAIIAGDGVIGLSVSLHLLERGLAVTLLAPGFNGAASPASAGMLAPSVERTQGAAQTFGDAARDAWPRLAAIAARRGGGTFEIRRDGILQIARTSGEAELLKATLREGDQWLDTAAAARLVPMLVAVAGAALHTGDGVVDVPAALTALRRAVNSWSNVVVEPAGLAAIEPRHPGISARLTDGRIVEADVLVLASGAWSAGVMGLPRALPIRPVRGTMVAVESRLIEIPLYDADGHAYLLPRGSRTVIGATADDSGFDATASEGDKQQLLDAAARLVPSILEHRASPPWAGLRPVTPDGLALIGPEPEFAGLYYACGHGRNGFLQAGISGEVIANLVLGEAPKVDLSPFKPTRFG